MVSKDKVKEVIESVETLRPDIINFFREIVAIPSMESKIGPVGERIAEEMKKLGFDEVRFEIGRASWRERV